MTLFFINKTKLQIESTVFDRYAFNYRMFIWKTYLLKLQQFISVTLLFCSIILYVEGSFYRERIIKFPDLPGWEFATRDSGMCSARLREKNDQKLTLLSDPNKYRGGVWYLGVTSRNHRLKIGVKEIEARLFLNGKHVATGKALDVGEWHGNKREANYVRFEFPNIDKHITDIKSARIIEIKADTLKPLKMKSLSQVITAIKKCQFESSKYGFWNNRLEEHN